MRKIIIGTLAAATFGCGQYPTAVNDFTIGNRLPLGIPTPNSENLASPPPLQPNTQMGFHPDRSYWYPSWGPFPICVGCESVTAYVGNNTDRPQRIGLAVYKHFSDGSVILYSREYLLVQPNSGYNQILIVNASPLDCPFSIFLTQIDANFNPFVINVDTDGYLIATYSGNSNLSCSH